MMLALSRNIMPAGAEVREGIWDRKKFAGVEVYGKTLGVVGLGKIGLEVALRMQSFHMKAIGFDPYVSEDVMRKHGIEPVALDELFARADYITLHVPINDQTKDMINAGNIAKMKDGVRIVNCSRGGCVNEEDLLAALESGKVTGAALDFLKVEKPADNPLPKHPKCLVVPHLGASTKEAQERVAVEIVDQVKEFLRGGPARNAANIPSVDTETMEMLGSHIRLSESMGVLATHLAGEHIRSVAVEYYGELADVDSSILTLSVLKGVLTPMVESNVNFVNAPMLAKERGLAYSESKSTETVAFTNLITVSAATEDGKKTTISGSVFPRPAHESDARIVRIDGYHVDARPKGRMLFLRNADAPGIVGAVGSILGEAEINIADMTLGRKQKGQQALTVFNVESELSPALIEKIKALPNIDEVKVFDLG
jgi:D-3-phosphoglycerate dehydrogenase